MSEFKKYGRSQVAEIRPVKKKENIMEKLFKLIQNFFYGTKSNIAPKETKW